MRGSASVTLLDSVQPSAREKVPGWRGVLCGRARQTARLGERKRWAHARRLRTQETLLLFLRRRALPAPEDSPGWVRAKIGAGRTTQLGAGAGWAGPWRGRDERDLLAFALVPLTMRVCAADRERRAQSNSSAWPSKIERRVPTEDVLGDGASTSGGRRAERRVARARSGPVRVCIFDLRSLTPALSASAPWSTYAPTHECVSGKVPIPISPRRPRTALHRVEPGHDRPFVSGDHGGDPGMLAI
jgi:hypothetical protein